MSLQFYQWLCAHGFPVQWGIIGINIMFALTLRLTSKHGLGILDEYLSWFVWSSDSSISSADLTVVKTM